MRRFSYEGRRVSYQRSPEGKTVQVYQADRCFCCNDTGIVARPDLIMDEPPRRTDPGLACKRCERWQDYPPGTLDERASFGLCQSAHELGKIEAQEWLKLERDEKLAVAREFSGQIAELFNPAPVERSQPEPTSRPKHKIAVGEDW